MILVKTQKVVHLNLLGLSGVLTYMENKLLRRTIALMQREIVDV